VRKGKTLKEQLEAIKKPLGERRNQNIAPKTTKSAPTKILTENVLPSTNAKQQAQAAIVRNLGDALQTHTAINTEQKLRADRAIAKLSSNIPQSVKKPFVDPALIAPRMETQSPEPCLKIAADARFLLASNEQLLNYKMLGYGLGNSGVRTQCHNKNQSTESEVVLGIDFGTSSTKIVIGDSGLEKAFAVPFFEANGIAEYLLPSRLYETNGAFSLHQGTQVHRDLKLALIDNIGDASKQNLVIAFLALAIRHSRAWLFSNHHSTYAATLLRWKLVVGLPVAHHLNDDIAECFREIADLAWLTANIDSVVSTTTIAQARTEAQLLHKNDKYSFSDEYALVEVIPEIAAQIYGVVNSGSFDPSRINIFMMVDVGAGTVDSSLFRVKNEQGRWSFEFYTSVVESLGAMNLHRHRIKWWEQALDTVQTPQANTLIKSLKTSQYPTDIMIGLPESYKDYFNDIEERYSLTTLNPDAEIYKRIKTQVQSHTFYRAWNGHETGFLDKNVLDGTPIFFCGGGMRLALYRQMIEDLKKLEGVSWLSASARLIQLPKILDAPRLDRGEFDRLSVAFGLSFLEVGDVIKAMPAPQIIIEPQYAHRNYFIDKDQV
jgi:hypothetical protein